MLAVLRPGLALALALVLVLALMSASRAVQLVVVLCGLVVLLAPGYLYGRGVFGSDLLLRTK